MRDPAGELVWHLFVFGGQEIKKPENHRVKAMPLASGQGLFCLLGRRSATTLNLVEVV
jgi:hypothetical protein